MLPKGETMSTGENFQQTLDQLEAAIRQFVLGDATPYKACWSQQEDVSIFGAWGAYEQGWSQVGPRLDWAAARFQGGTLVCERLAQGWSGDTGYSIWLEKDMARLLGQEEASPFVLRVTHLYRREEGQWKVIHRHADAIIDKTAASAILQRS
jgi:ketosteroid isomerase-like protein